MLSGLSRKRSIGSNPDWFTEFCNSQCLSHFAAPFIVVRAETSVAENCDQKETLESYKRIQAMYTHSQKHLAAATQEDSRARAGARGRAWARDLNPLCYYFYIV